MCGSCTLCSDAVSSRSGLSAAQCLVSVLTSRLQLFCHLALRTQRLSPAVIFCAFQFYSGSVYEILEHFT